MKEISTLKGKKFVASYSGGKDSILAIHRAIKHGMEPIALIITYNTNLDRSWFHGVPAPLIARVSASLGIPIRLVKISGEDYGEKLTNELRFQKENGAEVCIFGDIDIEDHLKWCTDVTDAAGIEAFFPLWQESREALVREFMSEGYTANITVIDTKRLSNTVLGKALSEEVISIIAAEGADICGENGEYHSFVSNGPIFKTPVDFEFGEKLLRNGYSILPVS